MELETEKIHNLGQHNDPISSMNYSQDTRAYRFSHDLFSCAHIALDALITGSWDRTVRFWDPRASTPQVASHEQPERVYFMDLVGNHLVVAMASRLFHIFDIRKMEKPEQTRESSLKFMTRALACMSDGQGKSCVSHFNSHPHPYVGVRLATETMLIGSFSSLICVALKDTRLLLSREG